MRKPPALTGVSSNSFACRAKRSPHPANPTTTACPIATIIPAQNGAVEYIKPASQQNAGNYQQPHHRHPSQKFRSFHKKPTRLCASSVSL